MMAVLRPVQMTDVQPSTSKGLHNPVTGISVAVNLQLSETVEETSNQKYKYFVSVLSSVICPPENFFYEQIFYFTPNISYTNICFTRHIEKQAYCFDTSSVQIIHLLYHVVAV